MSVLWCGGEDIDFPVGTSSVNTTSGAFRSGFARCAINAATAINSNPFPGGAITTAWLSAYIAHNLNGNVITTVGLASSSSGNISGIYVGSDAAGHAQIIKWDGTTRTVLATSSGVYFFGNSNGLVRADMSLSNYGSSATVVLYIGGTQAVTYSGSTAISGVSNLDCVGIRSYPANSGFTGISEIIVADESTLGWQGLATFSPTGAGGTQSWSNTAASNVNPVSINDANSSYTNTVAQDEEYAITASPSGTFQIKAVKIVARAMATSGATANKLKLGLNNTNNSTLAVGSAHTLSSSFAAVEEFFANDPTSSGGASPFGSNLTGYQIDLESSS